MNQRTIDADTTARKPTVIPPWIKLLSHGDDTPLDHMHILGFWDMEDGDWYANGHWNWKPWEMWERFNAKHPSISIAVGLMPFPAVMKRAYESASSEERKAIREAFQGIFKIIEGLARDRVASAEGDQRAGGHPPDVGLAPAPLAQHAEVDGPARAADAVLDTAYNAYRDRCVAENRLIPVHEYLTSLSPEERAELELNERTANLTNLYRAPRHAMVDLL